jgi:hypothetical protein
MVSDTCASYGVLPRCEEVYGAVLRFEEVSDTTLELALDADVGSHRFEPACAHRGE